MGEQQFDQRGCDRHTRNHRREAGELEAQGQRFKAFLAPGNGMTEGRGTIPSGGHCGVMLVDFCGGIREMNVLTEGLHRPAQKKPSTCVCRFLRPTQVVCESTHATTFGFRFARTVCVFCTSPPVVFFDFEAKMSLGCATWIVLGLLTVLYCVFLHTKDRKDWIPVRYNWDAYYEPPRLTRRNRSMWARFDRFLIRQMARRS